MQGEKEIVHQILQNLAATHRPGKLEMLERGELPPAITGAMAPEMPAFCCSIKACSASVTINWSWLRGFEGWKGIESGETKKSAIHD